MSEVKRFYSEISGRECVYASEYDAVESELTRLEDEFDTLEHANVTLKLALSAANQRNADLQDAAMWLRRSLAFYLCPSQFRACSAEISKLDKLIKTPAPGASE